MQVRKHFKVTGFSGNEIYCLHQLGFQAGQLCMGNSVVALGITGGIGAGLSNLAGGEITEITQLVHDGRQKAYRRMLEEASQYGGTGLAGVSFEVIQHAGNLEFVAFASTVRKGSDTHSNSETMSFSTAADVQELYCQMDAGFQPNHFVFSNIAYSIGVGGSIAGKFRSLKRGEVPQYTQIFDRTRHLALERLKAEAKKFGANCVIGVETTIAPLLGAQEMLMVGTASNHPQLSASVNDPVTSDMTNEELWNMVNIGYMPLQLVMGVSVYSLGLRGGIGAFFQSLGGGEVNDLTELLYEAREKALERIEIAAEKCGADEVVGVKTKVYDLGGGLVEFLAIGTAVKKIPGVTTLHSTLPAQAIIQDRETFLDSATGTVSNFKLGQKLSSGRTQRGPLSFLWVIFVLIYFALRIFLHAE